MRGTAEVRYDSVAEDGLTMLVPLLLGLSLSVAPTVDADRPLTFERASLANGLDVVIHRDDRYPLVAVRVVYHVGMMHDPVGKEGATHLLEHAMFEGTPNVAQGEHRGRLVRRGATGINAFTSAANTSYVETVPEAALDLALWLEADRMMFFDARSRRFAIERQRRIVTQELEQRHAGDASSREMLALRDLLAPHGHPLHLQDDESLADISVLDLAAIAEHQYGPANATLILAGAVPRDAMKMVERYFGDAEGGERPDAVPSPPALDSDRRTAIATPAGTNPAVLVGWPTPGLYEPGDADADLLAEVLEHRVGPGTDVGPLLAIGATQDSVVGGAFFHVRLEGKPGTSPADLLARLDAMLGDIANGSLEEIDVRIAAKRRTLALRRSLGTLEGRAEAMERYVVAGKSPDWLAEDTERFRRADRSSVVRFVKTKIVGRPRAVVFVAPSGSGR